VEYATREYVDEQNHLPAFVRDCYTLDPTGIVTGGDYYDRQHRHRLTRRAIHLLERQGYRVVLEPAA
jgi:hypothetical protein